MVRLKGSKEISVNERGDRTIIQCQRYIVVETTKFRYYIFRI